MDKNIIIKRDDGTRKHYRLGDKFVNHIMSLTSTTKLMKMAKAEKSEGHILRAGFIYSRVLRFDPFRIPALVALASIYSKIGKLYEAEQLFRESLKYQFNIYALSGLANIYYMKKKYDKSIELYKKVLDHSNGNNQIIKSVLNNIYQQKKLIN